MAERLAATVPGQAPLKIGGFFELEKTGAKQRGSHHPEATALCTGRACVALMLEHIRPRRVFLPFYSCNALYEPFISRCEVSYYSIDASLEVEELPELAEGEYLVYIDYFGQKSSYVESLKLALGDRLLIDDTHRFFHRGHPGHWSFCSARKYFGVPDGAYLYGPFIDQGDRPRNTDISMEHLVNRLQGRQELAFEQFQAYEQSLGSDIKLISETSEAILDRVDYAAVRRRRAENFSFLHRELGRFNTLQLADDPYEGFCYPFLAESEVPKSGFHAEGIFVPALWPDVLERGVTDFKFEQDFTRCLLPLPVDHRYRPEDLEHVVERVRRELA
jgi:hypothetical protein